MKNNRFLTLLLILALTLACNIPATTLVPTETPAASPTLPAPAETPTAAETATQTLTPLPSETSTITPTITPSTPMVTPLDEPVNCRFGPSTAYEQVAALLVGAYAQVLARNNNSSFTWWQVQNPSGGSLPCWVSNDFVTTSGNLDSLPVAPAPEAFITDVSLQVTPKSVNLGVGCPGPAPVFAIKGIIHANGPMEIKWRFETEKDGLRPVRTLTFSKFGDQEVSFNYVPTVWDKGNYWVRLIITSPSTMRAEATYTIRCS